MDNLDTVKTVHFVHGQDKPGVSCQEKLCTYFETEKRKKKKKNDTDQGRESFLAYSSKLSPSFIFLLVLLKTLSVAEY